MATITVSEYLRRSPVASAKMCVMMRCRISFTSRRRFGSAPSAFLPAVVLARGDGQRMTERRQHSNLWTSLGTSC